MVREAPARLKDVGVRTLQNRFISPYKIYSCTDYLYTLNRCPIRFCVLNDGFAARMRTARPRFGASNGDRRSCRTRNTVEFLLSRHKCEINFTPVTASGAGKPLLLDTPYNIHLTGIRPVNPSQNLRGATS